MIDFTQGWVATPDHAKRADIRVKSDSCVGTLDWLIGYGLTLAGLSYIGYKAFKNGSKAYEKAYTKALEEIGCID